LKSLKKKIITFDDFKRAMNTIVGETLTWKYNAGANNAYNKQRLEFYINKRKQLYHVNIQFYNDYVKSDDFLRFVYNWFDLNNITPPNNHIDF
jgi:hypothetical protein